MSDLMRRKDARWLDHIKVASSPGSGMYIGMQSDMVPAAAADRLSKLGYVVTNFPHNSAHKERLVITDAGREALSAASLQERAK